MSIKAYHSEIKIKNKDGIYEDVGSFVSVEDGVKIDPTLTISGQAADSKVVGDKFDVLIEEQTEIKEQLSELEERGVPTEKIEKAVTDYLAEHPVQVDAYTKEQSDNKYQPKGDYLTSVPDEYVTETELNEKGYLTEHQKLKTINGQSILGDGNIEIESGSDSTKPLGKVVVFGDSLSAGYNATHKWSDYLTNATEVRNHAVSGSTLGSGYATESAVRNQSFENQILTYSSDVAWADVIVFAYGVNDAEACASRNTTYVNVLTKAINAVKSIRSTNPTARIVYAYLGTNKLNGTDFQTFYKHRTMIDLLFNTFQAEGVELCDLTSGCIGLEEHMQSDGKHPTDEGIEIVGRNMNVNLLNHCSYSPTKMIDLYLGYGTGLNPLKYNWSIVSQFLKCHCTVNIIVFLGEGITSTGQMCFNNMNSKIFQWLCQYSASGTKMTRFKIDLNDEGNCTYTALDLA